MHQVLTFLLWLYTFVQNIVWIHQLFHELSSGHCFPKFYVKKGNNSTKIWWSVTKFKIDLPFRNMYICTRYHSDPSILG